MLSLLTNVSSLEAQRNVSLVQNSIQESVGRLSSGQRIQSVGDDPAGIGVLSRLSAALASLQQAQLNTNEGVSLLQTADTGLSQINNLLSSMRELAVESANAATMSDSDRANSDLEYQQLLGEIDRVVQATSYNGGGVIDGTLSSTSLQVGIMNTSNDRISLTIVATGTSTLSVNSTSVSTMTSAQGAMSALDSAITQLAKSRAVVGASQSRLSQTVNFLSGRYTALSGSISTIGDTDVAQESANLAQNNILLQAGVAVLAQANTMPQILLQLLR